MSVTVRAVGETITIETQDDLLALLVGSCVGQHVSIIVEKQTGIKQVTYLSISDAGEVSDTYTSAAVDLRAFFL